LASAIASAVTTVEDPEISSAAQKSNQEAEAEKTKTEEERI